MKLSGEVGALIECERIPIKCDKPVDIQIWFFQNNETICMENRIHKYYEQYGAHWHEQTEIPETNDIFSEDNSDYYNKDKRRNREALEAVHNYTLQVFDYV